LPTLHSLCLCDPISKLPSSISSGGSPHHRNSYTYSSSMTMQKLGQCKVDTNLGRFDPALGFQSPQYILRLGHLTLRTSMLGGPTNGRDEPIFISSHHALRIHFLILTSASSKVTVTMHLEFIYLLALQIKWLLWDRPPHQRTQSTFSFL
jgi:hypothetical protein